MNYSTRAERQKEKLKESLWQLDRRFRGLQEHRDRIRGLWEDDAAAELNQRYFNPHQEDSDQSQKQLDQQLKTLQAADAKLREAADFAQEISRLSSIVEKMLAFAEEDIARSNSEYDVFKEQTSLALAELPHINGLMDNANNSCR